jgi:hypothetical protein
MAITQIIARYQELCAWCDRLFDAVIQRFPQDMACSRGCHQCCVLGSVTALEALVMARALAGSPRARPAKKKHAASRSDGCPLLEKGLCRIYGDRPVICRTHGLPILDTTDSPPTVNCCPLNFRQTEIALIDKSHMVDQELISMNLMKLNLAFALTLGDRQLADIRVPIADILANKLHAALASVLK